MPSSAAAAHTAVSEPAPPPPPPSVVLKMKRVFPDFLQSVKLKYVKLGYHYLIQNALYLLLIPLSLGVAAEMGRLRHVGARAIWEMLQYNLLSVMLCSAILVFAATIYFVSRPRPVYMLDFACYLPEKNDMCSNAEFMRYSRATGAFNERSLDLQRRICERSGLGEETYLPPAVISEPPCPCLLEARREAERVMFGAIDSLFSKTSPISPKDIGIVIVNCSLFVPTPSLASIIVQNYNLRGNVKCFNLAGMGCSAGIISIDLAHRLLRVHPNTIALVVSMENITLNWYWGNDTSKLVSNCIFRMGGAAIMLSNKPSLRRRSKYELVHSVRTHKGADDKAFRCVFQEEDIDLNIGVSLSKDLMSIAGNALKTNITTLGPLVLPMSEQILFFLSLLARRMGLSKGKPYIPDFKLAFEHFCIHAGGRAVLDELEKNLELSDWHMEPSRMTLFRFGNTSSSSLWYELAYTEAKGRVRRGDRVWQIAFGSGFKCNSAVWRSLRSVPAGSDASNVWSGFIERFPVQVPTIRNLK